jgi:hypothetical protein
MVTLADPPIHRSSGSDIQRRRFKHSRWHSCYGNIAVVVVAVAISCYDLLMSTASITHRPYLFPLTTTVNAKATELPVPVFSLNDVGTAQGLVSSSGTKNRTILPMIRIKESHNKHFRLGFSGRIQTHVIGSSHPDNSSTAMRSDQASFLKTPLIDANFLNRCFHHRLFPSVYVSADYDFTKCWYGVTRIGTSVQFPIKHVTSTLQSKGETIGSNLNNFQLQTPTFLSTWIGKLSVLSPSRIDLTQERELLGSEHDSTDTISCRWSRLLSIGTMPNERDAMTVQLTKSAGPSMAAISIPIHSRIRLNCRLFMARILPMSSLHKEGNVEASDNEIDNDWWIPDVCIDALGLMESKNRLLFDKDRVGVFLSIRRRLNWSALGLLSSSNDYDADAEQTRIRFQVKHFSPTVLSMIEISSHLEQPLRSASLLLQQDRVISTSP